MKRNVGAVLVATIVVLIIASLSLFVVDQRQNAIVFRLGEVVNIKREPGLYLKIPLLDNVRYFDTRILTIDSAEPERFLTSEKKNVLVDLFVKWRIVDVRTYYVSVGGDEARARTRLLQTINDSLRAEFGNRTVHEVVSGERDKIIELMRQRANDDASKIGVQVLDVRMKRVDLPQEVSESVYRRMEAERKRVANELRSTGSAESEKIRADADRQREVILAQAYRNAQRIKGDGDAQASAIYAGAYQVNPEFFAFYRSIEAEFQEQERCARARAQFRVLQVSEVRRQGGQIKATGSTSRLRLDVDERRRP
jgi:modulator of FtsH protease HflC